MPGFSIGPQGGTAQIVGSSSLPASPTFRSIYVTPAGLYICLSDGSWTLLDTSAHAGTVTTVSVVSANGFSGSVADSTTTPAITINNPSALVATTSVQAPFFVSAAANPADAGAVRLGNTELIAWEKATPGTDLTLGVNASDVLVSSAPISAPSLALTTSPLPGTSGGTGQAAYAKGDILASPGSNTLNKLTVGSDGQVLTADTASTNGVKWAAAGGGGANTVTASILLSSTTVNLNEGTGAKQPLYTCPASRRAIITNIEMQKFSDTVSTAFGSMGWNVPANDFLELDFSLLAGVVTNGFNLVTPDVGNGVQLMKYAPPIGVAGDVLGFKVDPPEGSARTAIVDVYGYLTDTSGVPIANVNGTGDGATIAPSNITGTTTNNNASTGAVGELLTASRAAASATSLSTGTAKTITSVSLTAGDWDVFGSVSYIPAATTTTAYVQQGASQADNTLGGEGTFSACSGGNLSGTILGSLITENIPTQRISLTSTTTVYLVGNSSFAISTMTAYGSIFARRRR